MSVAGYSATPRIATLDFIRGLAVIGILLMNVTSFAMPMPAYINPNAWGDPSIANHATFALNFVLVDGKMRGLFSLLFGASMTLVVDRANQRAPGSGRKVHFRRMLVLALFGLVHYYFIWVGDILFLYAAVGAVAFFFLKRTPDRLLRASLMAFLTAFLLYVLQVAGMYAMQYHAASTGDTQAMQELATLLGQIGATPSPAITEEVMAMRGSYADIVAYRLNPDHVFGPVDLILMSGLETLGYMLAGAALMRSGFFEGQWEVARYHQMMRRYGIPAIIALTVLVAWLWAENFPVLATFAAFYAWSVPFDWMLSFAYAAALVLLARRWTDHAIGQRLAAAGRAAFTNYLGTSILITSLFYGYGLGLWGEVERWKLPFIVIGAALLMLLWSKAWLRQFHYGPLEWLWRTLSRGEIQPLRRGGAAAHKQ